MNDCLSVNRDLKKIKWAPKIPEFLGLSDQSLETCFETEGTAKEVSREYNSEPIVVPKMINEWLAVNQVIVIKRSERVGRDVNLTKITFNSVKEHIEELGFAEIVVVNIAIVESLTESHASIQEQIYSTIMMNVVIEIATSYFLNERLPQIVGSISTCWFNHWVVR